MLPEKPKLYDMNFVFKKRRQRGCTAAAHTSMKGCRDCPLPSLRVREWETEGITECTAAILFMPVTYSTATMTVPAEKHCCVVDWTVHRCLSGDWCSSFVLHDCYLTGQCRCSNLTAQMPKLLYWTIRQLKYEDNINTSNADTDEVKCFQKTTIDLKFELLIWNVFCSE